MDDIGFTDEEIRQLNKPQPQHPLRPKLGTTVTRTSRERSERISQPSTKQIKVPESKVLGGASLSKPMETVAKKQKEFLNQLKTPNMTQPADKTSHTLEDSLQTTELATSETAQATPQTTADSLAGAVTPAHETVLKQKSQDENPFQADGEIISKPIVQLSKIEKLQVAQAQLESRNLQKQKELNKTITEKFTKTAEQAKHLAKLQKEVTSLEKVMGTDISILRDRIDHYNRRCHDARKRYESAEQEYVAAKLELYNCRELKEGLQEHLFTIINASETKKSEKLEELNQKLDNLSNI